MSLKNVSEEPALVLLLIFDKTENQLTVVMSVNVKIGDYMGGTK